MTPGKTASVILTLRSFERNSYFKVAVLETCVNPAGSANSAARNHLRNDLRNPSLMEILSMNGDNRDDTARLAQPRGGITSDRKYVVLLTRTAVGLMSVPAGSDTRLRSSTRITCL